MKRLININVFLVTMLLVMLAFIFFITGCSSVKKTQESYKAATDSTRRMTKDSSRLATVDSGHLRHTDSSGGRTLSEKHKTVITITLDSSDSSGPTEDDYIPDDLRKPRKNPVKIKMEASGEVTVDLGNRRPAKIEITKTGEISVTDSSVVKLSDSSWLSKKDSAGVSLSDSSTLKKTVVSGKSSKKKIGPVFFIVMPLLLILFVYILLLIWKKIRQKS